MRSKLLVTVARSEFLVAEIGRSDSNVLFSIHPRPSSIGHHQASIKVFLAGFRFLSSFANNDTWNQGILYFL